MMKNVLLTGAGPRGFIGRNIINDIASGYKVYAPSSKELDLCNYPKLEEYTRDNHIELIVHSATHNTIVRGSENALQFDLTMFYNIEKLSSRVEKILYFGSGAEFDKRYNIDMIKEVAFKRSIPADTYGFGKYVMNMSCQNSNNIYNLRLFGIFGKYEYWPLKFISNLCCKAVFDLPLSVRQNCLFDFLDVDDLGKIVCWFLGNKPTYKDYNICTGIPVDLVSIAEIVREVSMKDLKINILNEGWNRAYTACNERLKHEYPAVSFTHLYESVEKLYKYYCDNQNIINYDVLAASK